MLSEKIKLEASDYKYIGYKRFRSTYDPFQVGLLVDEEAQDHYGDTLPN